MPAFASRVVFAAAVFGATMPRTGAACSEAILIEPPAGLRTSAPELHLRWQPLDGITEYRLQAEGRMPEGGTVWSVDLVVSGHAYRLVLPPRARSVAVKLRISAGCDAQGELIRSLPARVMMERR